MSYESENDDQLRLRRLRRDQAEDQNLTPVGFIGPGGELEPLRGDDALYVDSIQTGWSSYTSASPEGSVVVKNSPGAGNKLHVMSAVAADAFLFIFDSAIAPATGDTPAIRLPLPGYGSGTVYGAAGVDLQGWPFRAGITLGVSSTPTTYTEVASGAYFSLSYK